MRKKIILTTYEQVAAFVSFALKANQKIRVERMGNDFVGVYWEIYLG